MAFPARYKGVCKSCSNPIEVGQYITWSRREKGAAYHADCSNPSAVPEKTEASSADLGAIQEMIEATMTKLMASSGAVPSSVVASVAEIVATTTETKPKDEAIAKPKLKDNAQWFDLLKALTSQFDGEFIRLLLIGPPGTGKSKTSLVLTNTDYRVTMTEGMGVEDLIGMYQLVKGETVWVDGPVVRAMREGKRVLIDEIDHHPTEVGSLLYAFLDDNPELMLPTGEKVVAKPGYGVIATTNSNVTALPEAVLDRFEAILPAILPHPDALKQFEDESMRAAVSNHFSHLESTPWQWSGKPTLRRMRAFNRLQKVVGEKNASNLAFGTAGAEILGVLTTAGRK